MLIYTVPGQLDNPHYVSFQDQILYEYFNASLWRKIRCYGHERMGKDVQLLKFLIAAKRSGADRQTYLRIAASNKTKRRVRREVPIPRNFGDKQIKSILKSVKGGDRNETLANQVAGYMIENSGWCPDK